MSFLREDGANDPRHAAHGDRAARRLHREPHRHRPRRVRLRLRRRAHLATSSAGSPVCRSSSLRCATRATTTQPSTRSRTATGCASSATPGAERDGLFWFLTHIRADLGYDYGAASPRPPTRRPRGRRARSRRRRARAARPPRERGFFRSKCVYSHTRDDDPILMPAMPGQSMVHEFFGNTSTHAASKAADLRAAPATSCARARRLVCLLAAGAIRARQARRARADPGVLPHGGRPPASIQPFPAGLQMIAGNERALEPQPLSVAYWNCGAKAGVASSSLPPAVVPGRHVARAQHGLPGLLGRAHARRGDAEERRVCRRRRVPRPTIRWRSRSSSCTCTIRSTAARGSRCRWARMPTRCGTASTPRTPIS